MIGIRPGAILGRVRKFADPDPLNWGIEAMSDAPERVPQAGAIHLPTVHLYCQTEDRQCTYFAREHGGSGPVDRCLHGAVPAPIATVAYQAGGVTAPPWCPVKVPDPRQDAEPRWVKVDTSPDTGCGFLFVCVCVVVGVVIMRFVH